MATRSEHIELNGHADLDRSALTEQLTHKGIRERVLDVLANVTGHREVIGSQIHRPYEIIEPYQIRIEKIARK